MIYKMPYKLSTILSQGSAIVNVAKILADIEELTVLDEDEFQHVSDNSEGCPFQHSMREQPLPLSWI